MAGRGMGDITREIIRRIKGGDMPVVDLGVAASGYWKAASTGIWSGVVRARATLRAYMVGNGKAASSPGVSCRKKYRAKDLEPRRGWRKKLFRN